MKIKATLMMLAASLSWPATSFSHSQTERYIPIGQSPGAVVSVVGAIESRHGMHLMINGKKIAIEEHTPVWIDRSTIGQASLIGDTNDCKAGHFVEIRYHETNSEYIAEWIKIRGE